MYFSRNLGGVEEIKRGTIRCWDGLHFQDSSSSAHPTTTEELEDLELKKNWEDLELKINLTSKVYAHSKS